MEDFFPLHITQFSMVRMNQDDFFRMNNDEARWALTNPINPQERITKSLGLI